MVRNYVMMLRDATMGKMFENKEIKYQKLNFQPKKEKKKNNKRKNNCSKFEGNLCNRGGNSRYNW